MSIVRNNCEFETKYFMSENGDTTLLEEITDEKDLGVHIRNDLKPTNHCVQAVKKANSVLRMISKAFRSLTPASFLIVYKTYVRPHLDYCSQIYSPYLKKDINLIESVQRRATKMVRCLRNLSYEERLCVLKLTPLEDRRTRGDLIECYKIINKFDNVDVSQFFTFRENRRLRDVIHAKS